MFFSLHKHCLMCKKINARSRRTEETKFLFQETNNKERAKTWSSSYRYSIKAHLVKVFDKKVPDKYHKPHNPDDLITSQELIP